jgi:ABC-type multidrug transport system fused ATPase/permease subunit
VLGQITIFLCLLSGAALAQTKPGVAAIPLEVDPLPALTKVETELRAAVQESLEAQPVIAPSGRESAAALTALKRQDFRESNEAVAKFADQVGSLYAVYSSLEMSAKGLLVMSGRVVRNDGMTIKTHQAQMARGTEPLPEIVKVLARQFFVGLGLSALPAAKEMMQASLTPDAGAVGIGPTPPPPLVEGTSTQRTVGWVVAGIGAATTAIGLTVALVANGAIESHRRPGNLLVPVGAETPAQAGAVINSSVDARTVGSIAAGIGAATLIAGVIVAVTAKPSPVAVAVVGSPAGVLASVQVVLP